MLKLHFAYAAWASARLVGAAGKLSEAELTRDFGTSDKSVLATLVHTFAADRVWLGRVRGNVPGRGRRDSVLAREGMTLVGNANAARRAGAP